jgi:hypothetical protein
MKSSLAEKNKNRITTLSSFRGDRVRRENVRGLGRVKYRKQYLGCVCDSDDGGRRPLDNFSVIYKT